MLSSSNDAVTSAKSQASRLNRVTRQISSRQVDLLIMVALALLSLPLLLSTPRQFYFDLSVYLSVASNVLQGRGFVLPNGYPSLSSHPILFPMILASLLKVTGGAAVSALKMLNVFAVFTTWAVYALGRRLFNRWVGIASAGLVAIMFILRRNYSPAKVDTLEAFFLIVSLLFIWLSYKWRGPWLILSGLSMGMAFLQKEAAAFWAPVPWLLYLIDCRYRRKITLFELWGYTALVMAPIAWWMLWSYRWGGRMFPLNEFLTTLVIRWGGPALVAAAVGSLLFRLAEDRVSWFRQICESPRWRSGWLIVLLGAAVLGSPLLPLFKGNWAQPALPWIEIPAYVAEYSSDFPAFALVAIACCVVIGLALWRGAPAAIFSTLILAFGFAKFVAVAQTGYQPRHVLDVALFAYLVFIGSLYWGIESLQQRFPGRAVYWLSILSIGVFGLWFVLNQTAAFESYERSANSADGPADAGWFHSDTLLPTARWIEENLPTGTPLLTSYWMTYALGFETEGRYPVYALPLSKALGSERPDEPFTRGGYAMRARYPVAFEKTVLPEEIIYFDYSNAGRSYYFLMEAQLLTWIQELEIDYVVLAGDYLFNSTPLVDYFALNGAFEQVWQARYEPGMPVYVFQADRSKLRPQGQYPLVASPVALERVMAESEGTWDVGRLADYFIRGIRLQPLTKEDSQLALTLARHYLQDERFAPAYELYRSADAVAPASVESLLYREPQDPLDYVERCVIYLAGADMPEAEVACNLAATMLESSIPHIALGQVALAQDQPLLAIDYYQSAAGLQGSSTAYLGLGQAHFLAGQHQEAYQAYQQAVALEPFNQLAHMHVAEMEALLAQTEARWRDALMAYREAINRYPAYWPTTLPAGSAEQEPNTGSADLRLMDLDTSIEQNVFIINRRPMQVLLSPTAEYIVTVPPSAALSFSLGMSPDVWHLGMGDGAQFDLFVYDGETRWHPLSAYIDPKNIPLDRRWHDYEIDLSHWAGQQVTVTFVTSPGPNDNALYDWAGWGEPRILQPVAYDFLKQLPDAQMGDADQDLVREESLTINHDLRPILFQHPTSHITFQINVPQGAGLRFGLGLDPSVWSPNKGDGAEYNIHVAEPGEPDRSRQVFSFYLDPKKDPGDRQWFDFALDLSAYEGQELEIIFESLPGSSGDSSFDWGGWSRPVLVGSDALLLNSPSLREADSAVGAVTTPVLVEPPYRDSP